MKQVSLIVLLILGCAPPVRPPATINDCETYSGIAMESRSSSKASLDICRVGKDITGALALARRGSKAQVFELAGLFIRPNIILAREKNILSGKHPGVTTHLQCIDYRFVFRVVSPRQIRGTFSSVDCLDDGLLFLTKESRYVHGEKL
jgi:hypothetical protein